MSHNSFDSSPEQKPDPIQVEDYPFLNLEQAHHFAIERDEQRGCNAIILNDGHHYPLPTQHSESFKDLLLEREDNRVFLPKNYVTLGQALNDASGRNPEGRSLQITELLMSELAHGLGRVAKEEHMLPKSLSYLNVVYSREAEGARVMPPIVFVDFEPAAKELAKQRVIGTFAESLENGSANSAQTKLAAFALSTFTKSFDW